MPIRQPHALLAAALLLAGCSNPLDAEIPAAEKEQHTYLEKVLPKLGPQEREVVTTYIVGSALDGQKIPTGQTARKVLEMHKAQPHKIESLTESKTDKVARISFLSKSTLPAAPEQGRMTDQQLFTLSIENLAQQPISGIEGILSFVDLFGNRVATQPVAMLETVPIGTSIKWTGSRDMIQFESAHVALRDLPEGKYKATFTVRTIVLADGTKIDGP